MNRRHFRRRLSFVGASLAGLGFGRGSATQQPPGPPSSPPRSFAGPPRAGAAPSRAAAVSGPLRAAASAASARAPPRTTAPAAMSGRTATGAGPAADTHGFRAAGSRSAPGIAGSPAVDDNGADVRLYIDGRWNCVRGEPHAVCRESREMHRGTRGGGASPPTNTARPFSAQRFVERPCAPARAGDEPATRQTRAHAGGGPRIPHDGAE